MPDFSPNITFDYNLVKKRNFALFSIAAAIFLITIILYSTLVLRYSDNVFIQAIGQGIKYITMEMGSASLLGAFYSAMFGGLFFVIVPIEAVFIVFLKAGNNPFLLITLYIAGFIISYTFNYFVGMKLVNISKKIITPKKFYKIKGTLNKYGAWAIFGFNALPLPSQPLATILGVFKYNKTRFYTMFIAGQTVKFIVITLAFNLVTF